MSQRTRAQRMGERGTTKAGEPTGGDTSAEAHKPQARTGLFQGAIGLGRRYSADPGALPPRGNELDCDDVATQHMEQTQSHQEGARKCKIMRQRGDKGQDDSPQGESNKCKTCSRAISAGWHRKRKC